MQFDQTNHYFSQHTEGCILSPFPQCSSLVTQRSLERTRLSFLSGQVNAKFVASLLSSAHFLCVSQTNTELEFGFLYLPRDRPSFGEVFFTDPLVGLILMQVFPCFLQVIWLARSFVTAFVTSWGFLLWNKSPLQSILEVKQTLSDKKWSRVIKFKFPPHPHQKHYITQYEELGFS